MGRTIKAWGSDGEGRRVAQTPTSHGTFLVGVLYAITIIAVLTIVSML